LEALENYNTAGK